ncbi:MAG: ABC transporter permease [Kouleothrix sp.]|jgi:sodium transport system permease protein|nr:ABC transporter permease [Kouleothrix sp.]
MIERIGIILRKELTDHLRDRRTVGTSLFYPLLGPLMLILLFSVIGRVAADRTEQQLRLPVAGGEHAPALVEFLRQQNVLVLPAPADPPAAVRAGDAEAVLVIPPTYPQAFRAAEPATVQLVIDESRQSAGVTIDRVRDVLRAYSGQIGALRLLARGVGPVAVQALAIEELDVATAQSRAAILLNLLPYFIVFTVFSSGAGLAVDSTAGERERGSLEPLLINPVPRRDFVLAKLLAALTVTLVALIETLLGFALVVNLVPLGQALGVQLSFSLATGAIIFLLALPMLLLGGALQMIVATYSRGPKEASTYLQLIPLVPALPGLLLAFTPVRPALWNMLIPTFGQQLLINQAMRGESVHPADVALSAAVTLVLGAALLLVAVWLYQRDTIVIGR